MNSPSTEFDRSQPPLAPIPKRFIFPEFRTTHLDGGIKLLLVEDDTQPLISLNLVFKRGVAEEAGPGHASFTTGMLKKGTKSRSAQQIAEEIDFVGGSLRVSVSWDATIVGLNILRSHFDLGLELLADIVLHPTFPEEEIERLRVQTIASIRQNQADPGYLAQVTLLKGLFAGHPYSRPSSGSIESVGQIKREDCLNFYRTVFHPDNAFVVAAGNISIDEASTRLNHVFQTWRSSSPATAPMPALPELKGRRVLIRRKVDAVQSALRIGATGVMFGDPDYAAFQFINTLFGSFFISRLNMNLREDKGYTYGIDSYLDTRRAAGTLVIGTSVGRDVTAPAVREILAELRRISQEPISEQELELTRSYLLGSFALKFETPVQIIGHLLALELYNLPSDFYQRYFKTIASLGIEQLFRVQQRRFASEDIVIAASGDGDYLQKCLREFAPVEEVNENGELS